MMKMIRLFLHLFILIFGYELQGQTWQTLVPDSVFVDYHTDRPMEIIPLPDETFVVTGEGFRDILQARLDWEGNLLTQDTFYTWPSNGSPKVFENSNLGTDNNLFHCGTFTCCGPIFSFFYSFLKKTTIDGDLLWNHQVEGSANSRKIFKRVFSNDDGGCWVFGDVIIPVANGSVRNTMLYRLDSQGELITEKHYFEADARYELEDAVRYEENFLLMVNKEVLSVTDSTLFFLVNPDGDLIWKRAYKPSDWGYNRTPQKLFLDAHKNIWTFGHLSSDLWLGKINELGEIVFGQEIPEIYFSHSEIFGTPVEVENSGLLLTSRQSYPDFSSSYGVVSKVDSMGQLIWQKNLEFVRSINDAKRVNEQQIILCGFPPHDEPDGILVWDMDNEGNVLVHQKEVQVNVFDEIHIFPNPFLESFSIEFAISQNAVFDVLLFDVENKLVSKVKEKEHFNAGNHRIEVDAKNISTGIYWLCFQTEKGIFQTKKILKID